MASNCNINVKGLEHTLHWCRKYYGPYISLHQNGCGLLFVRIHPCIAYKFEGGEDSLEGVRGGGATGDSPSCPYVKISPDACMY